RACGHARRSGALPCATPRGPSLPVDPASSGRPWRRRNNSHTRGCIAGALSERTREKASVAIPGIRAWRCQVGHRTATPERRSLGPGPAHVALIVALIVVATGVVAESRDGLDLSDPFGDESPHRMG